MISNILRILPYFKGKQRLARLFLKKTLGNNHSLIVNGKFNCYYKIPNTRETIGFEILVNGVYEESTILFIANKIPARKYLLDIGANIGAITIPVKRLRPDIPVICVEAAPWIFDFLQHNIERNEITDIVAINKAIAAEVDREVEFFSPQEKFGKGSMAPVFTSLSVKVNTTTLDALTKHLEPSEIGLIKIDVEGFESHAFRGGNNLLNHAGAPDVLFEFVDWAEQASGVSPGEAQRVLMAYGYQIYLFSNEEIMAKIPEALTKGSVMLYATKGTW